MALEALARDPQDRLAPFGVEIVVVGLEEAVDAALLEPVRERVPVGEALVGDRCPPSQVGPIAIDRRDAVRRRPARTR